MKITGTNAVSKVPYLIATFNEFGRVYSSWDQSVTGFRETSNPE